MHSGDSFTHPICKCMDCAGERFKRAERKARTCNPDDYFSLVRDEDDLQSDFDRVQNALKEVQNDKRELIWTYYHKLVNEAN